MRDRRATVEAAGPAAPRVLRAPQRPPLELDPLPAAGDAEPSAAPRLLGARYGPSALLIAVCLLQLVLARTDGLTPWKGGGFGMFSTVDGGANRRMRVTLVCGASRLDIRPPDYGGLRREVRNYPTEGRLRAYVLRVAQSVWVDAPDLERDADAAPALLGEGGAEAPADEEATNALRLWTPGMPIPRRVFVVDEVEVTIDRPRYDGAEAELRFEPLCTMRLPGLSLAEVAERMGVPPNMLEAHL